jgi:hypothetical protein
MGLDAVNVTLDTAPMRTITTIQELVRELGGPSAMGRYLGVTPEAVSNWQRRGHIPSQWYKRLRRDLLEQRDIALDDSLFDFHEIPPAKQRAAL